MNALVTRTREIRHAHLFCGLGGGAKGFNRSFAQVGNEIATYRCLGGVDNDPAAIADFSRLAGVQGTVLDLFDRAQYTRWHGHEPPSTWREATPDDIRKAFNYETPNVVFTSSPCKGLSALLAESVAKTDKYQALNELTVRGIWLTLEAYADDPVEFICFENVPRIMRRGRPLLDQIIGLLDSFGYAASESVHDCGELGGLAQSRKRFLLLARHRVKVPPFLYEPPKRRLRGVGEILEQLPLPGDPAGGPMHRIPALQFQTWARLAFVEAGRDWRSLNRLRVVDGKLADFGLVPERPLRNGAFGVRAWAEHSGTVAGETLPTNGTFAVADPRIDEARNDRLGVRRWADTAGVITGNSRPETGAFSVADVRVDGHPRSVMLGLRRWDQPAPTIKGDVSVGGGPYAVADVRTGHLRDATLGVVDYEQPVGTITANAEPTTGKYSVADIRVGATGPRFNNVFRVVAFDQAAPAVTGQGGNSASCVADPRGGQQRQVSGKYRVVGYEDPAGCVIGASTTGQGAYAVADARAEAITVGDPRPACFSLGRAYESNRAYGLMGWNDTSLAVPGSAKLDNGPWSVADPRAIEPTELFELPAPTDRLVCVIIAQDNTWHRPFTTLELAGLQGLIDPEDWTTFGALAGKSDSAHRERIGNAVPSGAATAIGNVIAQTLLLAWRGETFQLSDTPIWVRQMAIGLTVDQPGWDSAYAT